MRSGLVVRARQEGLVDKNPQKWDKSETFCEVVFKTKASHFKVKKSIVKRQIGKESSNECSAFF